MATARDRYEVITRLEGIGFSYNEAVSLRRVAMALSRWSERECNGEIERDETTGKPYACYEHRGLDGKWFRSRSPIADKESAAANRLGAIMAGHPELWAYQQGDPRGASLYIGRKERIPKGSEVDNCYSSFGVAVY